MKIFFSILLSICFLNSFSQTDTVKNKLTVGISPLLFISPTSDILSIEYQPKEKFSFELCGGFYNSVLHSYDNTITSGFTVRTGMKFYLYNKQIKYTGNTFLEILCFYRQVQYKNRLYNENSDTNTLFEQDYIWLGGDPQNAKYGDELKQVICLETLLGKKYSFGKSERWVFEYFLGLGIRLKLRDITIYQTQNGGLHFNPVIPYKEKTNSFLPTTQFGIKFGYSF